MSERLRCALNCTVHKNTSFNPGPRQRTDAEMIIADALTKNFGYTDADTDNIYAPPVIVSIGGRKKDTLAARQFIKMDRYGTIRYRHQIQLK